MNRITDPLRAWARETSDKPEIHEFFDGIADQIEAEHARRMRQQSFELKRAFCRYVMSVVWDYRNGMKRSRADMLEHYKKKGAEG